MNRSAQKRNRLPRRRRYLVHLCYERDESSRAGRDVSYFQLWTSRRGVQTKTHERVFTDEYQLTEIINPLLAQGSDVRNVIGHIENPDGFTYLPYLSSEEANNLGWRE